MTRAGKFARGVLLILIGQVLAGCGPAVVATGAVVGVAVVHDRRTTGTVIDDQLIGLKVAQAIGEDPELETQTHIDATSYNGVVLLTGEAPDESLRSRAATIARGIPKVRHVHNELTLAAPSALLARSNDGVLKAKIKARMVAEKDFDPTRIKVVVEQGTVYLMGLVTRHEAEVATEITRTVSGVQRVVKLFEYVTLPAQ